MPQRLRRQRARPVDGRDRIAGVLAEQTHVPAERDRRQPVFGLAEGDADDARPEAEREAQHLHVKQLREHEVPQLVHQDEHAQQHDRGRGDADRAHARSLTREASRRQARAVGMAARRDVLEPLAGQRRLDRLQQRRRRRAVLRGHGHHREIAVPTREAHPLGFRRGQEVDLVHHPDPPRLGQAQVRQDRLDGGDLLLVRRVGGVDDVQQQIGLVQLLQRRPERARQIAAADRG